MYQFLALPFGLATAPYVFSRVASQLANYLQAFGIPLPQYIDDWLTHAQSSPRASRFMEIILQLTQSLGWLVNVEKSEFIPKQRFIFPGIHYDLSTFLMFPKHDRYTSIQVLIRNILATRNVSLRTWQSLLGHLQSLADQVQLGRLHTRPLHTILSAQMSMTSPPEPIVKFSDLFIPHLEWWLEPMNIMAGVHIGVIHPQVIISSDSSSLHWGAQAIFIDEPSRLP